MILQTNRMHPVKYELISEEVGKHLDQGYYPASMIALLFFQRLPDFTG